MHHTQVYIYVPDIIIDAIIVIKLLINIDWNEITLRTIERVKGNYKNYVI